LLRARNYYLLNKERIKERRREYQKKYTLIHKGKRLAVSKTWAKRDKIEVINFYSNSKNCCTLCGFGDLRALSIDHIGGGGCQHRMEIKIPIYRWLIKTGFPSGYQVLCMNCQFIKRVENKELERRQGYDSNN